VCHSPVSCGSGLVATKHLIKSFESLHTHIQYHGLLGRGDYSENNFIFLCCAVQHLVTLYTICDIGHVKLSIFDNTGHLCTDEPLRNNKDYYNLEKMPVPYSTQICLFYHYYHKRI